jgi:hypothetical protein
MEMDVSLFLWPFCVAGDGARVFLGRYEAPGRPVELIPITTKSIDPYAQKSHNPSDLTTKIHTRHLLTFIYFNCGNATTTTN